MKGEDKNLENKEVIKSDVAKREEEILAFWQENKIFEKSLEKEAPNGSFVFYDGPPFATGEPHYGHILAGTIKDIVPRYKTMTGFSVGRRWGWDCHGLPVENLIEKELGLKTKKDILDYGIDNFNEKARESVMRYADVWKKAVPRVGRWVDMENDYRTMDKTYTESVWWSFKNLYDKGLVYKGFKSMHLCPRCETTLSNFEVNQGYKDITDISVYVKFHLLPNQKFGEDKEFLTGESVYILVWTTTPWTLPGNVALAVSKDIQYSAVRVDDVKELLIVSSDLLDKVLKNHKVEVVHTFSGLGLVGLQYKPLFDYYSSDSKLENRENGWQVYEGDFVTSEDGTGIVHIAPAFGEDDYNLLKKHNLPFVQHVKQDGTFKEEVRDFTNLSVKPKSAEGEKDGHQKTDIEIIKYLAHNNLLFAKEKIIHSYPHCWRCDSPLLNFATSSWFIKVTDLKDKMLQELSKVKWLPKEIGENRFGNWIEGARDWAVSRARFWGAPIPVWVDKQGDYKVIGSIEELKKLTKNNGNHFIILRHGQAESNEKGIVSCNKEDKVHLTEKGKVEVKNVAEKLVNKSISKIYASPFIRTKETAEIVAEKIKINQNEIIFDDRLVEYDFGDFSGKPFNDYLKYEEKEMRLYDTPIPNGESYLDAKKRFSNFIYDIDGKHKGETILVVTHGIGLEVLEATIEGADNKRSKFLIDNSNYHTASILEFDFIPLSHNENFEIDLHKPFIDNIELIGDDGEKLERVPDVFDCWYESGSMFFAQNHYPFENKDDFDKKDSSLFPANFIAEGLDQTRGWFYTLLVLGVGLFGKSPYENVVVNGLVLAEDGRKMSKKLKNYPDLMDMVNKYGADAMRYFLIASPLVKAEDYNFSEKGVDEVYKKIVLKLENVLSFYEMYKVEVGNKPDPTELDSWMVSRLGELRNVITESLDKFELDKASRPILPFIDDLSTWYVRLSRERFKSDDETTRNTSLFWTRFILEEFSKLIAPFMPFLAENIYQRVKLGFSKESIHLEFWPGSFQIDQDLLDEMVKVRELVSSVLEVRFKENIKVKQPLSKLSVKNSFREELLSLVSKEVNVKEVVVKADLSEDFVLDTNITEELKEEGIVRELVRGIQEERKNKNFSAKDKIAITFNESNKDFVEKNKEKIMKGASLSSIDFSSDLDLEVKIDDLIFRFSFK